MAAVTAAVVGAGATIFAASKGASAASRSADAAESAAASQNAIASRQLAMAEDQYDRYKTRFMPIEDQFINESEGIGSIANQELSATRAASTVADQTGQAKIQLEENLASLGVDASDPRYVNALARMQLSGAAQSASAQTGARETQATKGRAALGDVINIGKGLPVSASSGMSSAASGMASAGQLQVSANNGTASAWNNAAAGFGGITGSIINSKPFQSWLNSGPGMSPNYNYGGNGSTGQRD